MRRFSVSVLIIAGILGLPSLDAGQTSPSPKVAVNLVTDQAEAVLSILAKQEANQPIDDGDWHLKTRETSMNRSFEDSDFKTFVLSEQLGKRAQSLRETLENWKRADIAQASRKALAYLPAHARIRAKIYPVPIVEELAEAVRGISFGDGEKYAVLRALQVASERGFRDVKIRSDYNAMRRKLKTKYTRKTLSATDELEKKILKLAMEFDRVHFGYVPKRKNQRAHILARQGRNLPTQEQAMDLDIHNNALEWQIDIWNQISDLYLRETERRFVPVVDNLINRAGLIVGEPVLDLGTGTGAAAIRAAQQVGSNGDVTGMDISPQMLSLAQQRLVNATFNHIGFCEGRAESIPAADSSFDVVLASLSLMYVIDGKQRRKR